MFVPLSFIREFYRTIIVLILIFYLSTVSGEEVNKVSWISLPYVDKIGHLLMYLTLSITFTYEIVRKKHKIPVRKTLIIIVLFAIMYGGVMELIQEFLITTRSGDWIDFGFNVAGASLGMPFFLLFRRNVIRNSHE